MLFRNAPLPRAAMFLQILLMAAAMFVAFPADGVQAQEPATGEVTADAINAQMKEKVETSRRKLVTLRQRLDQPSIEDLTLAELRLQAEEVASEVALAATTLENRLSQIQARLGDLGEAPAAGQPPEAAAVTDERNRLMAERAELTVIIDDAANLKTNASQAVATISTLRRELFAQMLFKRTELSPDLFYKSGEALVREMQSLRSMVGNWMSFAWKFKKLQLLVSILLSLAAALIFLLGGRRLFARLIVRDTVQPTYIKRLSLAFWTTVTRTLSLAAFLVSSYVFLDSFNVLRRDVAPIIAALFGFIWFVYFIWQLADAVLSPRHPDWRLVRVTDRGGKMLVSAIVVMAVVNGLDYFLGAISEVLNSPLELTIAKSVVASLVIGVILFVLSFAHPIPQPIREDEVPVSSARAWPRWLAITLRVMGAILILTVMAGYAGLARFFATQIVLTGAVLVTIYIGILSGKAVGKEGAFARTALGERMAKRFRLGEVALDQIGIAAGLLVYIIALFLGIPMILLTWGFQVTDIEAWVYRFFTRITVGNISISIVGILGGLLLFGLGYLATRWIQRWIDGHVLARSHVDTGVRNSVKTGIGYLGIGIAMILGVSAAGIDLSSLALVASALSVGIGFGLQNVVSNFVSGLILLVERPFKVGDHVVTGTTEGIVKRISVRATEIETFRKQSIIVPNSDLINSPVGNWTHRNRVQRSEIPVSVAYGTDPQKVMAILLEIARSVPEVLRNPEPHVDFTAFGASSLDFELRFFLADYSDGIPIRASVRTEILKRFEEEGIDIPYTRQDIMILPRRSYTTAKDEPGTVEDGAGV